MIETPSRDPQNPEPRELQINVARPVTLKRGPRAVVLEPVELDHDAGAEPYRVHQVPGDRNVHRGWRQFAPFAKPKEPAFELGSCLRWRRGLRNQGQQSPQPMVSFGPLANPLQGCKVEQSQPFSLLQGALELGSPRARGEIEQGSGHARHGNALKLGSIVVVEAA